MDIRLSGETDGVEAARRIREELGIPVIFLTAYSDEALLDRAKRLEPVGYILKPFEKRQLATSIEVALHKHRAEEGLRATERWLEATLNSMGEAVITTDLEGNVTYLNPLAAKLVGWAQSEALGRSCREVSPLVSGGAAGLWEDLLRRAIEGGEVVEIERDAHLVARDGARIPVGDSLAPIRDAAGRITGAVMVLRDLTRRRDAEAKVKRAEDRRKQLEKLDAVGRLAGGVAHHFNNLMTVVIGYCDLLLSRIDPSDPASRQLASIREAGISAAGLTRQFLAFGRQQPLDSLPTDLNSVVSYVLPLLRQLAGSGIAVEFSGASNLGLVSVDRAQFENVLLSLGKNARDAMREGGRIVVETVNLELEEPLEVFGDIAPAGSYVRLTVSDDGPGMATEALSHLFEPFYTTKEIGEGTGLGLAAVYGTVRQSGGYVRVESRPGEGTRVEIYLRRIGGS
jgi:PAS domain S-box-containing protein